MVCRIMNQTDKMNKKINAAARQRSNNRGKKEQEEMDKGTKQKQLS